MKSSDLSDVLAALETRLGESRSSPTGFYNFLRCPWKKHSKRFTFGINPKTATWSCFACGDHGSLADLGLPTRITGLGRAVDSWLLPRKPLVGGEELPWVRFNAAQEQELLAEKALEYLASRGISHDRAVQLGLGYGVSGKWVGYVIHPWFDDEGNLGGWQGRLQGDPQEGMPKVHTTSPSRKLKSGKVIGDGDFVFKNTEGALIGLESVRAGSPVVLGEGPYDQISVSRVVPATAGMGSKYHPAQIRRVMKRKPSAVIWGYDPDKSKDQMRDARAHFRLTGRETYVMEWGDYLGDWAADDDGDPLSAREVEVLLKRAVLFRPGM
jgi:hypothetical protein